MRALIAILVVAIVSALAVSSRAENTLIYLNTMRRSVGLYALQPDAYLQQRAEQTAQIMARRRLTGHIYGRPAAGRMEGIGRRNGRRIGPAGRRWDKKDIFACYSNTTKARFAGCSSVYGSDGMIYYVLLLR